MSRWIEPVTLRGAHAVLEPLARAHRDQVLAAAADGELWRLWYTAAPGPETIDAWLDAALDQRERLGAMPFVVRRAADDRVVGVTRMFNVDAANRRLEIGHTWYSASVQRSAVNTECKAMLLAHAFDALGCIAVEMRTHFMNRQSRAAIERLGAKLDGVLRHHQLLANGTIRDTCVYSIVAPEWPAVRENLRWQLERPRPAGAAWRAADAPTAGRA
ncbi:GNAT family N-acetyltransferase [Burkholderiaceae bacterium FT117]|uniref:GNAT family N-acetyltransferase n=1 Tax=Zeimonas sediminis TaxID=2944268 RepID=UPI0023432048|nr:GNAT family protein [Zeimonas sediminis]MCM5568970.1 GNAT family N-acetyltransferase [Zeimonas sediminis]